jgi:uncharacterized protein with LGFP repeats
MRKSNRIEDILSSLGALLAIAPLELMLITGIAFANPAEEIASKARQLHLGNPHPETPAPKRTPAPRDRGFWQRFDGGWVYWSSETGAHAVYGAIFAKWAELRWEQGLLGFPLTDELAHPDGRGRFNDFQGGTIYWTPRTGAHEIHGRIRDKWVQLGGTRSFLGYPLTDETPTPGGRGRFNHFEGGSVYWTPQTDAHEVHGAIRDKWASLGWERSPLGYPISEEFADGVFRRSNFERGHIRWSAATGAQVTESVPIDNGTALNPVRE